MKIVKKSDVAIFDISNPEDYIRSVDSDLEDIALALQGRTRFGGGTDGNRGENIAGEFQKFTSDGTPDTEFSVSHGLGTTPVGRIILWQDKAGSLYQGPTTGTNWDSSNVHFKCDVASVEFLVFLIK